MIARLLRGQAGHAGVTETILAAGMMVTLLGATLGLFDGFSRAGQATVDRNDAQDAARRATSVIARDLRNLASPIPEQPAAIDLALPFDLVVKTVDGSMSSRGANATGTKRVRYCLDRSNPANVRLHQQTQTWTTAAPPAVPSTASCPAAGWTASTVAAEHLVNTASEAAFAYDAGAVGEITAIHVDLRVDRDAGAGPSPAKLATGVFLRNQNRRPTASFTATPTQQGIVLNGSASTDPEGRPLTYEWYEGTTLVGTGVTYRLESPSGSSRTLSLRVVDPAGLEATAPSQTVVAS